MKVSVCVTVLNEEGSIAKLLDSLVAQSKKPDEIVIVDGGSSDKTLEVIRHYQKRYGRIKYLVEPGCIAHGRNTSIDLAANEIVALTDAGCYAREGWLEKISYPFRYKNVGLVAGFYDMPAKYPMQQAINVFHGVPPQRFDLKSFLPSARSVAFRKEVWEKVGGFDEKLDKAGEDTKFFYKCVKLGVKIVRVKEARVVWEEAENLTFVSSMKKFYQYARGDAKIGIWWHPSKQLASHNIKIMSIFIRYLILVFFLVFSISRPKLLVLPVLLVLLYLFWSVWKWRDVVVDWSARAWLPVIQVSSDFAVMTGFLTGLAKK
jgi:glycosyltransferase involved in cell wall biosynthesis